MIMQKGLLFIWISIFDRTDQTDDSRAVKRLLMHKPQGCKTFIVL